MAELKDQNLKHYIENYVNLRNVTLCYLFDKKADRVLLAMKKRGFGAGKLNGVGGKVEKAESIEDALLRETREEINVNLKKFEKVAVINFYFKNNPIKSFLLPLCPYPLCYFHCRIKMMLLTFCRKGY